MIKLKKLNIQKKENKYKIPKIKIFVDYNILLNMLLKILLLHILMLFT